MEKKNNRIIIFDTTLRDGEQSPGCSMSVVNKIKIAEQLAILGVDIIEAGFAIASPGDTEAISAISQQIGGPTICSLARIVKKDIEAAARSLEKAKQPPRIHLFVGASAIHMKTKLRKSPQQIIKETIGAIKFAKKYFSDIEFSPEDASRSGTDFLIKIIETAIDAGATTINIPDTVGYSVGYNYRDLITRIKGHVKKIDSVVLSAHCHNDLGLAVANTLTGIDAGVRQLEGCILGIGERAGNAQLEAIIMALKTRKDYYKVEVNINTKEIGKTARLVSLIIGKPIPDNLPIVGANAFAHGAGIHADGVSKKADTYEIMSPLDVGWEGESTPLTKHSGRRALKSRLNKLDHEPSEDLLEKIYQEFIKIADSKTFIYNDDLIMIIQEIKSANVSNDLISIKRVDYHRVNGELSATITLSHCEEIFESLGTGDGPAACVWQAIDKALNQKNLLPKNMHLKSFNIAKAIGGVEALGLVNIAITMNGYVGYGRGSDTDIICAFAKAMIAAINHLRHAPVKI